MKKLSKPMEDMIKGAARHDVRVNGKIVKRGFIVAGRSGTIVALMDRELVTGSDTGNYGANWLTADGIKVWEELTGKSALNTMILGPDVTSVIESEDHPTESDMITDDMRGEAEKTFDVENAAAERADIEAEHMREIMAEREEAMDNWHDDNAVAQPRTVNDFISSELDIVDLLVSAMTGDRLVIPTSGPHATFVTLDYLNTMSRIRADRSARLAQSAEAFQIIRDVMVNQDMFAYVDARMAEGMSFRQADRSKRILRQIIRPTVFGRKPGQRRKHKASKTR